MGVIAYGRAFTLRAHGQQGEPCVIKDLFSDATHHEVVQTSAPMGRHGDQVAVTLLLSLSDDGSCYIGTGND